MMTTIYEEIEYERKRQIDVEGFDADHDANHKIGELSEAAACYALTHLVDWRDGNGGAPLDWPWEPEWWKPTEKRRDLIKAAALIVAEIEKIDRKGE
jgi:hypothetical protein